MALKKFKPALDDCQQALYILSPSPSSTTSSAPSSSSSPPPNKPMIVKTLLRLARCQFAVGSISHASSSLTRLLSMEQGNQQAKQLQQKISGVEGHIKNFEKAYQARDWGMARLALDKCTQAIDAEGGQCPSEWRVWKVELELARGDFDSASISANEALRAAPNSPDALALRGLVLFLQGKLSQSLTHASSALRYDPGNERAGRLRKRVKDVERLKEEGNVAFKQNRLLEAMDRYSEALEVRFFTPFSLLPFPHFLFVVS
ncbi:hypothetical protein NMY22_g18290 [Coprinellus aureogranulatus]|nr:hypothetical protein NMY22_g18290 [Coprinellus aureogranulatus]